jgi:N-acetylglucosamine-6-sulfatase
MGYQVVRTERFKYIHYLELNGMDELYDLDEDPYEIMNIIHDPKTPALLKNLDAERVRLLDGKQVPKPSP